ncbi:Ig-like domain-containing protein [Octadecabacter arcticus]|uniref:Ig-like domain-containing protein n=1 Tax=Octadecabacter arcticus TaxID=53946 RepID=UPI0030845CE3
MDTIVEPFNFSSEKVEGDDIINAAEAEDGVVFSSQVEPLSSVLVEFGGQKMTVSAGGNGQWSANFPASSIQHDEYTTTVTATATDQHGNVSQPITRTIEVDTLVNELTTTDPVEGDNVVNYSEASDGVTLGGTVEAGSSVMVTFQHVNGSVSSAATVDAAGNWTIDFAASEIPGGDYDANVTILATDANGNTDSITDTFRVDTVDPDAPEITAVTITPEGVSSLRTETTDNDVTVNEITAAGTTNQLADQDDGFALPTDQTFYSFEPALPNGSHLVVNETDTSGNSNATFMVMEEAGTNAVDMGGLGGFDIGAIDLSFAKDSELSLDVSTLEGLSDADNNLIVHGGVDDSITLIGAANTGTQTSIGGNDYNVYTMGDDAQVFIEEDIVNVTI